MTDDWNEINDGNQHKADCFVRGATKHLPTTLEDVPRKIPVPVYSSWFFLPASGIDNEGFWPGENSESTKQNLLSTAPLHNPG